MPALLLALLCASFTLPSQEPEPVPEADGGCRSCSMSGVKDCKKHPAELAAFEAEVRFCSVAAACTDCSGALSLDCGRCADGPQSLAREVRAEACQRWMEAGSDPGKLLQRPLVRIETAHFEIIIDAPLKEGSKTLSPHEFAHHVARELEAMAQTLDAHYGASAHSYSGRTRLWYWQDPADHALVNREIFGRNVASAMKFYTRSPAASAWAGDKGLDGKALNVAMNACHVAAHLMMSSMYRQEWLNDKKAGWFDEGAGHWYEDHRFQRTATYCMDEANSDLDWKGGQWRVAIREWLAKKCDPILPALVQKLPGTLWPEEHGLSWSLYDWVASVHPTALKPLLMGFKDGKDARDLFREQFRLTVPQVEEAWRAWVQATYPVRDPKVRKKLTDKSGADDDDGE